MKKILFAIVLSLTALKVSAYDFLRAVKDSIPGGYNFWIYTPVDYFYSQEQTPVIIFLHGASLCGRDLSRVRRYGPLDAIVKGRDIDALTIVPQNPGGAWSPKKVMDVFDWVRKHYACGIFGIIALMIPLTSSVMSTLRFIVGSFVVYIGITEALLLTGRNTRRVIMVLLAAAEVICISAWYFWDGLLM